MQLHLPSFLKKVAVIILLAAAVFSQDEPVRIYTSLVVVPVVVADRDGRRLPRLTKEQFSLFENGVQHEVTDFQHTDQPLTVLLLLDNSRSMSKKLGSLAIAANTFVRQLRADDQIIAAVFSTTVTEKITLTKISNFSGRVDIGNDGAQTTELYEAINYAFKKMRRISGRTAIVVFSDGMDSGLGAYRGNFSSAKSTLNAAVESGAMVYTIRFDSIGTVNPADLRTADRAKHQADTYMIELAERTGGRSYQIENQMDLTEVFGSIISELSAQYTLGYYPLTPGRDGERRRIQVKVNIPDVAVRSRSEVVYRKSPR